MRRNIQSAYGGTEIINAASVETESGCSTMQRRNTNKEILPKSVKVINGDLNSCTGDYEDAEII